jgi:recombination protein RecA
MAAAGVDLAALPVVWAGEPTIGADPAGEPHVRRGRAQTGYAHAGRAVRAAEQLLRSGAFGLIIIDLAKDLTLRAAGQGRLLRLAEQHDAEVLIIRRRREDGAYAGSLVAVRSESTREQIGPGLFRCTITNTKDKREGPGWTTSEEFDGPPGLY